MKTTSLLPTFAQLTAPVIPTANDDAPEADREATRRWLQRMERDICRARDDHTAGKLPFLFNRRVLERGDYVQRAEAHGIDYFGLCLLLGKQFARNPFTRAQIMQAPARRKLWFDRRYRTDDDLRDEVLATLYALMEAKRFVGLTLPPQPNTASENADTADTDDTQDTDLFRELDAALQLVYANVPGFDVRDLSPPKEPPRD